MNETCVDGGARRLVDARFLRGLDAGEKTELEGHLVSCSGCNERYRRMQLAERVASVGAERAFEEPSALEIERIAADLHLIDGTADRWAWWRGWRGAFTGLSAAVAIAAALAMFVLVKPQPEETILERGGSVVSSAATFRMFVVGASGSIAAHEGASLSASDLIKIRMSWGSAEPRFVAVAIADAAGNVRVAQLGAPKGTKESATVPGAVALAGSAPGEAVLYLVASEQRLDDDALRAAVIAKPSNEEVRASLKTLAVDRRTITIAQGTGK